MALLIIFMADMFWKFQSATSPTTSPSCHFIGHFHYQNNIVKSLVQLSALTYDEESSEIHDEDEPTDCLSDRQAALLDGGEFYVPECTSDGRYKKVQKVAQ